MVAHDISRHLFRPGNHYTGLRMQQGRVALDSDFNEARMLDDEQRRLFVRDVIGPHGTPDSGFKIAGVHTDTYDFDIKSGTFYLGGLRHEIAGAPDQTFLAQTDWLQSNRAGADPALPTLPVLADGPRHDLVYLVGWEQGVTSVEDSEIREQAITATDTGFRIRRMHRVQVLANTPADCTGAFDTLLDELRTGGHTFDPANYELLSAARISVTYHLPNAFFLDLCHPTALQGFSGAENETIRVQLIAPDRFLWSLDNASPLYRIEVIVTEVDITIKFKPTTLPRDAAHYPRVDQVLEILPWGAELANGEKIADHPIAPHIGGSVLARVLTPYDPIDNSFKVSVDVPGSATLAAMVAWYDELPDAYFFGRIWNPGDDAHTADFGVPFTVGVPVPLQGTGFTVTIDQAGIVGDHWILSTRPETTHDVVPWNLANKAAPHGPRRFYSPLAVIHWSFDDSDVLQVDVHDCRRTFRPLTRIRGCCTVTVGDNDTSFGDFTSINDAIAAIPLDEAGKICILPGTYKERILLDNRDNLTIEGCGARTKILTPDDNDTWHGLVNLASSDNITIRSLHLEAIGQIGVMFVGGQSLTIDRVDITTRPDPSLTPPPMAEMWLPTGPAAFTLSTIAGYGASPILVRDCTLTMRGGASTQANVWFLSGSGTITGCRVLVQPDAGTDGQAYGGIQLVYANHEITDNLIQGGSGHGVCFGAYISETLGGDYLRGLLDQGSRIVADDTNDCPTNTGGIPPTVPPVGGGAPVTTYPTSGTAVIRRNRITGMGGSGISVLGFWSDDTDPYWMIDASDSVIADNIIENNCQMPPHAAPSAGYLEVVAWGGIVLAMADDVHIYNNVIQNNGTSHRHPICGIYILHGENVVVENNRIRGNGPRTNDTPLAGPRAGIALQLVGRQITLDEDDNPITSDTVRPAARVRGNVVEQPAGRALQIYGIGPIFVEGNTLIGEGLANGTWDQVPHCVEIHNIGQSPELLLEGSIPSFMAMFPLPHLLYVPPEPNADFVDGRVLFVGNQVHFAPASGTTHDVFCATRILSYGDVGVLDNQFLTVFPASSGAMYHDTIVTAWSIRVTSNRWEDPDAGLPEGGFQTDVSATTLAWLNATTFNQATRCIHVTAAPGAPPTNNPLDLNQTIEDCTPDPGFADLLDLP